MCSIISGELFAKLAKYGFFGAIATMIHVSVASWYVYFVNQDTVLSNLYGFLFAFIFSYVTQSYFVFKRPFSWFFLIKYFLVQFSLLVLAVILADYLSDNAILNVFTVALLMPVLAFFIHSVWTFTGKFHEK